MPAPGLTKSIILPSKNITAHVLILFPTTLHIFCVFNPEKSPDKNNILLSVSCVLLKYLQTRKRRTAINNSMDINAIFIF